MASSPLFLVAEFDGAGTQIGELTRAVPGSTIDIIADPPLTIDGQRMLPMVMLLRGFQADRMRAILEGMAKTGRDLQVLQQDLEGERTLVKVHAPPEMSASPAANIFARFLGPVRNPWTHVDEGTLYLRGRISFPDQADDLLRRVRRDFELAGVEAQVDVQPLDRHDLSVWEELVQATLGLSR